MNIGQSYGDLPPEGPPFGGKESMNGYSLKQFSDFQKNWKLVTVRFRRDTGEMRFTYANDKAWQALIKNQIDYPDGAVFAKIGVMTQPDPAFTSSSVPSGVARYQLMVHDREKHKDTAGWGYALFDSNKLTFNEDPVSQAQACDACHQAVPQRGYVFSQPMHVKVSAVSLSRPTESFSQLQYMLKNVSDLPEKVRKEVPPSFKHVFVMTGPLAKNLFQGTLDEIRPTLAIQALRERKPAVLVNDEGTRFSMVYVTQNKAKCPLGNAESGAMMKAVFTVHAEGKYPVQSFDYCESVPENSK